MMRTISLLFLTCLLGTFGRADTMNVGPPLFNLCGIGVLVMEKNGSPIITEVLPETPALKAGLMMNDKIIQVDGQKVDGLKLPQVVGLIRGQEGTVVKITVAREGKSSPLSFVMTRVPVHLTRAPAVTPTNPASPNTPPSGP